MNENIKRAEEMVMRSIAAQITSVSQEITIVRMEQEELRKMVQKLLDKKDS